MKGIQKAEYGLTKGLGIFVGLWASALLLLTERMEDMG
jgi:hypothetical protein